MTYQEKRDHLTNQIATVQDTNFKSIAIEVFNFQATYNPLYKKYIELLHIYPKDVSSIEDIPFLPISFFKSHSIKTADWEEQTVFTSSGTSGQQNSKHYVHQMEWYLSQARLGFQHFYGKIEDYCFLALLPSYLEREGSSLIYMAQDFIQLSESKGSGFFLKDYEQLSEQLQECQRNKQPTILLGVSFALLDFAEQYPQNLSAVTIMETGGMKGRRKEMTREELHEVMQTAFNVNQIHSEYGMTELFSQAYSEGEGRFYPAPSMRVMSRDITDPFQLQKNGKTGVLNIIDLANIDTISFIATDDLGKCYEDNAFEVLGRLDYSDVRGCNLMVADL